jgi:ParB-like chromosome segregation protein Spo0J
MSSMLVAPKVDSVQLSMLAPCPDNATIYGAQSLDDPDILSLIASIREIGVTDPIRVSTEGVIISGHRRRFCAFQAGVRMVPVIREPISSWLRAIGKLLSVCPGTI